MSIGRTIFGAVAASALAGALAWPASPGQAAGQRCEREVADFLENLRTDQAWPRIRAEVGPVERRLVEAAGKVERDCFAALQAAQARLGEIGLEIPGVTDAATAARIERLAAATADVDVIPARPEVEVVNEPAEVVVEKVSPDVEVIQEEPEVVIRQPAPEITVVQPDAQVIVVDPEADAAAETERRVIAVREVAFGFDSAEVTPDERRDVLADVVRLVDAAPAPLVLLTGYASPIGDRAYNEALSERRAAAVAAALRDLGVAEDRIRVRAKGERNLEVPAGEAERSARNRRVEVRVVSADG